MALGLRKSANSDLGLHETPFTNKLFSLVFYKLIDKFHEDFGWKLEVGKLIWDIRLKAK